MRRAAILAAGAATGLLAASIVLAAPAGAHGKHDPSHPATTTVARGLVGPLSLADGPNGITFVTENFAGTLDAIKPDGTKKVLYSSGGDEVGGVSYLDGKVTFTQTGDGTAVVKRLRVDRHGNAIGYPVTIANTRAFEEKRNPDARVEYGFRDLSAKCLAKIPADFPIPTKYTGAVDSHPYSTLDLGAVTFVADAGANTVLAIWPKGKITTVAVLPAQPAVISAEVAKSFNLPKCAYGATYWFEAVPTDVERGPKGLYVSTLPGGPEDASLGARGGIYTVNPFTGHVKRFASGLLGATNVAVSPHGQVFATQLFGGAISEIKGGAPGRAVFTGPTPAAVEWTAKGLKALVNALPADETTPPDGQLILISLKR